MKKNKGNFPCVVILVMIGFLLFTVFFVQPVKAEDSKGQSAWIWSENNPKPVWWKWDYGKNKPMRGGYVRLSSSVYIGLMNPNHFPVLDWRSILEMYEHLINIGGDYRPTTGWLAESYQYIDPLTCSMRIRKNVKFHDGTDLNAESVKYTMDWIKDRKNGAWTRPLLMPLKSVEVLDEYTVRFHFDTPWAAFLGMMSTVPGAIISKKALEEDSALKLAKKLKKRLERMNDQVIKDEEKVSQSKAEGKSGADKLKVADKNLRESLTALEKEYQRVQAIAKNAKKLDTNPVGTGRYMLEEGRPGNYLKLKRNPNWWFGRTIGQPDMPYPDGIIVMVITDPSVRLANLRAGRIHEMGISSAFYNQLKNDPNFTITSINRNRSVALKFNTQSGPCKDIRIRKAISHAIDRQALVAGITFGQARVSNSLFNPEHWCYNPNLKPVTYDPELSKKLLAEAGYPAGLPITGYVDSDPAWGSLSEAIKSMLADVGVEWKVDMLDQAAATDRMRNLEYDLASGGWSYLKDPDLPATGLYHPDGGFNFGRSNNPEIIKLVLAGRVEMDEGKRQKIYQKLQDKLYETYEDAWLFWPNLITARNKNLLGYDLKLHHTGGDAYWCSHPYYLKDGKDS